MNRVILGKFEQGRQAKWICTADMAGMPKNRLEYFCDLMFLYDDDPDQVAIRGGVFFRVIKNRNSDPETAAVFEKFSRAFPTMPVYYLGSSIGTDPKDFTKNLMPSFLITTDEQRTYFKLLFGV
jgi:hypothetical protein